MASGVNALPEPVAAALSKRLDARACELEMCDRQSRPIIALTSSKVVRRSSTVERLIAPDANFQELSHNRALEQLSESRDTRRNAACCNTWPLNVPYAGVSGRLPTVDPDAAAASAAASAPGSAGQAPISEASSGLIGASDRDPTHGDPNRHGSAARARAAREYARTASLLPAARHRVSLHVGPAQGARARRRRQQCGPLSSSPLLRLPRVLLLQQHDEHADVVHPAVAVSSPRDDLSGRHVPPACSHVLRDEFDLCRTGRGQTRASPWASGAPTNPR